MPRGAFVTAPREERSMKKLKLAVDTLAVESFPTDTAAASHATVAAYEATPLCVRTLPVTECLTENTFRNC